MGLHPAGSELRVGKTSWAMQRQDLKNGDAQKLKLLSGSSFI